MRATVAKRLRKKVGFKHGMEILYVHEPAKDKLGRNMMDIFGNTVVVTMVDSFHPKNKYKSEKNKYKKAS